MSLVIILMKSRTSLFLLLLSLTASLLTYAQTPPKPRTEEDYNPRTLKELSMLYPAYIAKALKEHDTKYPDIIVHTDLLPSRVKVIYEGTTRPINQTKKNVIRSWANRPEAASQLDVTPYQTEMLFTENNENYWLPVPTELLSKFGAELNKGDAVQLFVVKIGNVRLERDDVNLEPVILVEKFLKQ